MTPDQIIDKAEEMQAEIKRDGLGMDNGTRLANDIVVLVRELAELLLERETDKTA